MLISTIRLLEPIQKQDPGIAQGCPGNPHRFIHTKCPLSREFNHTVIKDAFRGQGLSAPLIKAALDDARGVGKQVIATCSAVAHFIEKNPEYRDLLRSEGI